MAIYIFIFTKGYHNSQALSHELEKVDNSRTFSFTVTDYSHYTVCQKQVQPLNLSVLSQTNIKAAQKSEKSHNCTHECLTQLFYVHFLLQKLAYYKNYAKYVSKDSTSITMLLYGFLVKFVCFVNYSGCLASGRCSSD